MYKQTEAKVRDWLAEHLDFIEPRLTLIGKEYHLPDSEGAKGFVDLLCKDIFNNFVIIEIKRASATSRQTMNEVLKYHSLLKHNFRVRESEIRIIIISTHWEELIRAFTETCNKTTIDLKGYTITIQEETCIPESIKEVHPLYSLQTERRFAYYQSFDLFLLPEKRESFRGELISRLNQAGVGDFVLVELDAPANNKIVYPFTTVLAFQQQNEDEWRFIINDLDGDKEDDLSREHFQSDSECVRYLENWFLASLKTYEINDSKELGFPEKFQGLISQGWTIKKIFKFGIFNNDPRYSDDLLIKELKGYDGNNRNKYTAFSQSSQKERLLEICQQSMRSLVAAPAWYNYLKNLFDGLLLKKEPFKIIVDVYNPDSIITSLFLAMTKGDPNYLPTYKIIIAYDNSQKTEMHLGDIFWNGKEPKGKLFTISNQNTIWEEIFRIFTQRDNLTDSAKLALIYTNKKVVLDANGRELENDFIYLDVNNEIQNDKADYRLIEDYIVENKDKISILIRNYSNYATHS